jgi:hypothetical protein
MKKAISVLTSIVVLILVALKLAVAVGLIGPPTKQQLGSAAIDALHEYCELVAKVQQPEDVRAIEAQELQVRGKALDASRKYTDLVQAQSSGDKETLHRFLELAERFQKELKRYEELHARAFPNRPRL